MELFSRVLEFIGAYEPEEVSVNTTSHSTGDPDRDYGIGQEVAARGRADSVNSDRVSLTPRAELLTAKRVDVIMKKKMVRCIGINF